MIIMAQDRRNYINTDVVPGVYIHPTALHNPVFEIVPEGAGCTHRLGVYKTEAEAAAVIEQIVSEYNDGSRVCYLPPCDIDWRSR